MAKLIIVLNKYVANEKRNKILNSPQTQTATNKQIKTNKQKRNKQEFLKWLRLITRD